MTAEESIPHTGAEQPRAASRLCGRAVASLVLGLLSIGGGVLLTGLPAVILGHRARELVRGSAGWLRGGRLALAGLICGYTGIAFTVPVVCILAAPKLIVGRHHRSEDTMVQAQRIYNACQAFNSVRGSLPASLDDLVPDFLPDAEPLRDPEHPEAGEIGFYYYGSGSKGTEPATSVFLASKTEVRGQRVIVQFGGKVLRKSFQPPAL